NAWHQVAFTLDGGAGRLYVDGIQVATAPLAAVPRDVLSANDGISPQANYLARDWGGTLFKGSLAEPRFYNVPLAADELELERLRRGTTLGVVAPVAPLVLSGTATVLETGVRNGRTRTLSAWVKPARVDGSYQAVLDSGDELEGRPGNGLGIRSGKWIAKLDGLGEWETKVLAPLGKWQHVALAFDGSQARFLVNGRSVASCSYPGPVKDSEATGKCFRVGYSQSSAEAERVFFEGSLLNVRVESRMLSASDLVLDTDGDGFWDALEADWGSHPLSAGSLPPSQWAHGRIVDSAGNGIAGARVIFSQSPSGNGEVESVVLSDSQGRFSRRLTEGAWYAIVEATGFNRGSDRVVTVSGAVLNLEDWALSPNPKISGSVRRSSDGAILSGVSVSLWRSSDAFSDPEASTLTDASGNYAFPVSDGNWWVAAGGAGYFQSARRTVVVSGSDALVGPILLRNSARNIPRGGDLILSAFTEALPNSLVAGSWAVSQPEGGVLTAMGTPQVEVLEGIKWWNNSYFEGDGFRLGQYESAIPVNGASVVVVVKPDRNTEGTPWTSLVDFFGDQLVLGVRNVDGQVVVWRKGEMALSGANTIPEGRTTVLSLVVQPGGDYTVYADGVLVMSGAPVSSGMNSLVPGAAGVFAKSITLGRNYADAWSAFHGRIGDVLVYRCALSAAERVQLEADLANKYDASSGVVPVSITSQPSGVSVNAGAAVTLSVSVEGTPPLTYQWRKGGVNIPSAQTVTLSIPSVQGEDAGNYDVLVTNPAGSVASALAVVSVRVPVSIVTPPVSQTVDLGSQTLFGVVVRGSGTITYQWSKDGSEIEGARAPTYVIPSTLKYHQGDYTVTVRNDLGTVISSPARLTVGDAVSILSPPSTTLAMAGGTLSLGVVARGVSKISYQWRRNGVAIEGATAASLVFSPLQKIHEGSYDVSVSSWGETVFSQAAIVRVMEWGEVQGRYEATLLREASSGSLAVTSPCPGRLGLALSSRGVFSGLLEYEGFRYSFRGLLNRELTADCVIRRSGGRSSLVLRLKMDRLDSGLTPGPRVAASVRELGAQTALASASLEPWGFDGRTLIPDQRGHYTAQLAPAPASVGMPSAPGYATLDVTRSGMLLTAGRLPDGSTFSCVSLLRRRGEAAFYVSLYSPTPAYAGYLSGPVTITLGSNGFAAGARLEWRKPVQPATVLYFPAGFSGFLDLSGEPFGMTVPGNAPLAIADWSGVLNLDADFLPTRWTRVFSIRSDFAFLFPDSPADPMMLTIDRVSGVVRGRFLDPDGTKFRRIEGVFLQRSGRGVGFFLGDRTAGQWSAPLLGVSQAGSPSPAPAP
ncbi:MAG: hypothetical protein RLZZ142_2273, partial [Verrucomicrobiota bacterium]